MKSDTSKAIVPISFIRDANAKLLERLYLIKLTSQQDSIITLNKLYISNQAKVIFDLQGRIVYVTNDYNKVNVDLTKAKNNNKLFIGSTIAAVGIALAVIFIK